MKTTALDNILEAFDKMDLFSFKKYVDENRGILTHKNKQQIIDAVTHGNRMEFYDATETAGEQYYTSTFETNKETLK